jgi:sulfur relay (sulfurtransferase) DsrF/TusC family protein
MYIYICIYINIYVYIHIYTYIYIQDDLYVCEQDLHELKVQYVEAMMQSEEGKRYAGKEKLRYSLIYINTYIYVCIYISI